MFDVYEQFTEDDFERAFGTVIGIANTSDLPLPPNMEPGVMARVVTAMVQANPGVDSRVIAWCLTLGITAESLRRERLGL